MSDYLHALKILLAPGPLSRDFSVTDAYRVHAAILDGGVPDVELGALMAALVRHGDDMTLMTGLRDAADERLDRLVAPARSPRTVVMPNYGGEHDEADLAPLIALLLRRFGIPVVIHGALEASGALTVTSVLREFGVLPCASHAQAQAAIDDGTIALVPASLLAPGLAVAMSLRGRLGVDTPAHVMARCLTPVAGTALHVWNLAPGMERAACGDFFGAEAVGLLVSGGGGQGFGCPVNRPRVELYRGGDVEWLFDAATSHRETRVALPSPRNVRETVEWMRGALEGKNPLPLPIVNQLACCLYGAGYAQDFNQAKAIAAVETGSLAAA